MKSMPYAATVLLLRESTKGLEVYMIRRNPDLVFMPNYHVFVGGRVDKGDHDRVYCDFIGDRHPLNCCEILGVEAYEAARAIYVAAIRETFEESGILLGYRGDAYPDINAERQALIADKLQFSHLLRQFDFKLPLSSLHYLAHWITPPFEVKRFDTYFFIAEAPSDQNASHDGHESTSGGFRLIDEILAENERDEVLLAPPTLCVLEDLRSVKTIHEAIKKAPNYPMPGIMPRKIESNILLMPDDERYDDETTEKYRGQRHYLKRVNNHWSRVKEQA